MTTDAGQRGPGDPKRLADIGDGVALVLVEGFRHLRLSVAC